MKCGMCGEGFTPSKFKPKQKYCSSSCRGKARAAYKLAYDREWRRRHPGYMSRYMVEYRA